jgi:exosortase
MRLEMNSSRRSEQLLGAGLMLALFWTYWTVLYEMGERWWTDPKYSHGYFVPLFAAWLLWRRYRQNPNTPSYKGMWWGLPVFVAGMILHLAGVFFYIDWLSELALLPSLTGLCVCLGGWSLARVAGPSIAFLGFMLPLPYRVEVALAYPLQQLATVATTFLLQMVGLTAGAEGNIIVMDSGRIGVEDACNGLGMLVTFVALATGVAIVLKRPLLDKMVIVGSAIPVALLANIIRITVTGVLMDTVGGKQAMVFYHVLAGYFMMSLALLLIWMELKIWSRLVVESPVEATAAIGLGLGLAATTARSPKANVQSRVGS